MGILILLLLAGPTFAIIAYFSDKANDQTGNDNFKRGGLFARYGSEIYSSIIPLMVDYKKTTKSLPELCEELKLYLRHQLGREFAEKKFFELAELKVTDLRMSRDVRYFMRFSFTTPRNSRLHCVIYFPILGNQLIVQQTVYIRGNYYWWDVLRFILLSPFTVLFWARGWFRGEQNIIRNLSTKYDTSSFDYLDLLTVFKSTTVLTQTLVMQYAKNNNLLTEELEKIIVNNITNSQNININQSSGVSLGSIAASFKK